MTTSNGIFFLILLSCHGPAVTTHREGERPGSQAEA
jgi:hypothetical protein